MVRIAFFPVLIQAVCVVGIPVLSTRLSLANVSNPMPKGDVGYPMSKEDVNALCNQGTNALKFHNIETPGNDCTAPAQGQCESVGKRAFIPKCQSSNDWSKHHFSLQDTDGNEFYSITKHDGDRIIYGAAHGKIDSNCRGTDVLAHYDDGILWNIVVSPDMKVSLHNAKSCPPIPPPPPPEECKASHVKGEWQYVFTVSAPVNWEFDHGTTKSNSETKTKTWDESVTVSVMQGWELFGQSGSITVGTTIGHTTADAYQSEWSSSTEEKFTVQFNTVGKSVWQFFFSIKDTCNNVVDTLVKEYAMTEGKWRPPCCVPGYATDAPNYTTCHSQDAMIAHGEKFGCKVANSTGPPAVSSIGGPPESMWQQPSTTDM